MATEATRKPRLKNTDNVQIFKTAVAPEVTAAQTAKKEVAAKKTPAKKTAAKKTPAKKTASKQSFAAGSKQPRDDSTEISVSSAIKDHLPKTRGALTRANPRRMLLAEFMFCFVVLGAGTIVAPQGSQDGVPRMAVKGTGLAALFLILALVASGGKTPAKAAAGFGALVTVAYLFTSSDAANIMQWISGFYSKGGLSSSGPATEAGGGTAEGKTPQGNPESGPPAAAPPATSPPWSGIIA